MNTKSIRALCDRSRARMLTLYTEDTGHAYGVPRVLLRKLATSLRRKPAEWTLDRERGLLRVTYPRGCVVLIVQLICAQCGRVWGRHPCKQWHRAALSHPDPNVIAKTAVK